ncbi:hypothetical protein N657DRAFT_639159 [Parathielavia appendiculata]|uniref:Uncharacterized protein n=1 Tax=Parathielavia appendiculata TaxID=2587402 RepID=A0AAN6U8Z6_9PEZI|nr:hypothetical protein N657DRAFT_639159 [Parathielavia appendiculata]
MRHTAVLPLFSSILLLGGMAAAVPVANTDERCKPQIICVDAVNPCGIKYGGCYDVCDVSAKPVAPPCPSSTTKKSTPTSTKKPTPTITKATSTTKKPSPSSTKKPTPTTTKKPPVTSTVKPPVTSIKKSTTLTTSTKRPSSTTTSACTATAPWLCWDGINECGMMYGGCFPDCKPWPTFAPPPCPTKDKPTVITRVTTLPTLTVPHYD